MPDWGDGPRCAPGAHRRRRRSGTLAHRRRRSGTLAVGHLRPVVTITAVVQNPDAARLMGINVERYFGLAWAMTGVVSAIGGIIWGNLLGVDINLSLVGLKVFPVVILGGLDSIPGAVVGGLIVGLVENVAAGYVDPYVGGGTKDFAPYVLMILALMIRPYGIFGKKIIERI